VVPAAAPPHPDIRDAPSQMASVIKRAASKHPEPDPVILDEFRKFVRAWIHKNLRPLGVDCDISFETWIELTNYPRYRKEALRRLWESRPFSDRRIFKVKAFTKDEEYLEFKYNRGIYSRSDEFKCLTGPWFKQIEKELYKLPYFVKNIPVADRPAYICGILFDDGAPAVATDYTAFESQFVEQLVRVCEFQLYEYMTQHVPGGKQFMELLEVLVVEQEVMFTELSMLIPTCRMSGEMNTSLGNGFSNLMFALFLAHRKGCTNIRMVVEGDDGLMKYDGPRLCAEDFALLGLSIKLENHDDIRRASFCGIIFDTEDLINVTDPREVLATFGWGTARYLGAKHSKKMSLLRAKSLSLAHQYPGCPILSELAQYGLRMTRSYSPRFALKVAPNLWVRDQLLAAISDEKNLKIRKPGLRTRALVEEVFGISMEAQLSIEQYLADKNDLSPLCHGSIDDIMPLSWNQYAADYIRRPIQSEIGRQVFGDVQRDRVADLLPLCTKGESDRRDRINLDALTRKRLETCLRTASLLSTRTN
jgi:hypothetical protein